MPETKLPSQRLDAAVEFTLSELAVNNGNAALPSYSFSGDQNTGMYLHGADELGFSTNGTSKLVVRGEIVSTVPFAPQSGSVSAPSYTFDGDADTGFYRSAADAVSVTNGSGITGTFTGSHTLLMASGSSANPAFSFINDADTGIYTLNDNSLRFTLGATQRFIFDSSTMVVSSDSAKVSLSRSSNGRTGYMQVNNTFGGVRFHAGPNGGAELANQAFLFTTDAPAVDTTLTQVLANGQWQFQDGSAAVPALSFINDANTGFYRDNTDRLTLSLGGAAAWRWEGVANYPVSDNTVIIGQTTNRPLAIYMGNGTAGAPAYAFGSNTNSGIWLGAANDMRFSTGGVTRLRITNTSVDTEATQHLFQDGSAVNPAVSFIGDTNLGLYRIGTDEMGVSAAGGNLLFRFGFAGGLQTLFRGGTSAGLPGLALGEASGVGFYRITGLDQLGISAPINLVDGSSATPAYGFASDLNTGMYRPNTDTIAFTTGGSIAMVLGSTQRAEFVDGTAGAPALTFLNDIDTGIFRPTTNTLAFTVGSTEWLRIDSSGNLLHGTTGATGFFTTRKDQNARTRMAVVNDNSGASASTDIYIGVNGGGAQDPRITFAIGGPAREWVAGIDNSDSDIFVLQAGVSAVELSGGGAFAVTPNATPQIIGQNGTSSLPYYSFYNAQNIGMFMASSVSVGFNCATNGNFMFFENGTEVMRYDGGANVFGPGADNTYGLGQSGGRWKDVWAANGVIQTSHSSTKTNIVELDPATVPVPEGVMYDRDGRRWLGYLNDVIPAEGRPVEDPLSNYEQAVLGVLCAHVKKLETDNAELKTLVQQLINKLEA